MEVETQIVVKIEPREVEEPGEEGEDESSNGEEFLLATNHHDEEENLEELETADATVFVKKEGLNGELENEDDSEIPSVPPPAVARRSTRKRRIVDVNNSFGVVGEDDDDDGEEDAEKLRRKTRRSSKSLGKPSQSPSLPHRPGPKSRKGISVPKTTPEKSRRPPGLISELERKADKFLVVPLTRCDKQKTDSRSATFKTSSSRSDVAGASQLVRFACQDCQKPFPTLEAVSQHLMEVSEEFVEEIPCSVCESTFSRLSCLKYHLSTHFRVKCRFCDEFFTRDLDLFEHFTSIHLQKQVRAPPTSVFTPVPVENNEVFEENSPFPDANHFDDDVASDCGGVLGDFNEVEPSDDPDYRENPAPAPKRGRGRPRIHPKVVLPSPEMKLRKKHSKKKKEKKRLKNKKQDKPEASEVDDNAEVPSEPPPPKKRGGRPPKVWDPQELWEFKRKQEARRKAVLKRMKDQVKKAKSNRKKNAKKKKLTQDDPQTQLQTEENKPEKPQPLSHQDFLRAHRIHRVVTSSDLISRGMLTSDPSLKRCSPSVGNGTFENPFWMLKNNSELHCICPACGRIFRSRKELSAHHHQSHSLICGSCTICGKPQVKSSRLARHLKSHCNSDELKTRYEEEVLADGEPAPKQENRLYKCGQCSKILIGWLPLTVHEKYWHDIEAREEENGPKRRRGRERKSFICELCGKSVKTEHNLKKHKKKHKRAMKRAAEGGNEERERHDDQAMCPTCGKVFKNNKSLKNHERYKHSEERMAAAAIAAEPMDCPICGRPFKGRRFMHTHMPTHLSKEEKLLFDSWDGTLQEFLEHLGTGIEPKLNVEEEEDRRSAAGTGYHHHHQNQIGVRVGGSASSNHEGYSVTGGMSGVNVLNAYAASSSAYFSVFGPR